MMSNKLFNLKKEVIIHTQYSVHKYITHKSLRSLLSLYYDVLNNSSILQHVARFIAIIYSHNQSISLMLEHFCEGYRNPVLFVNTVL